MNKLFLSGLLLAVMILSGCSNQPKAVIVDYVPAISATQPVATATATGGKKTVAPAVPAITPATAPKQTAQIPDKFSLNILFAQQAPFGNWDAVHEETCEEASMIMIDRYLKHQPLNEQIMEEELQKLLQWEQEHGYKLDLTAQETVDVLQEYFGVTARLSKNVTIDQIKYELSQNKPIIIPAAGRALGNPNFKYPGPIYHMLVIKGYDNSKFITNDPGTRKGNNYVYPSDRLINAIHDWNPALAGKMTEADMLKGEKVIVVVDN